MLALVLGRSGLWRVALVPRAPACTRLTLSPATEHGGPALGEGDLDLVEVARDLGGREYLARLLAHFAPGITTRDAREREQPRLGVAGDFGGLASGAVRRFARALGLRV